MVEACENCKHCRELYFPPTMKTDARHEYCCTLFLDENSVMYLDTVKSLCECFTLRNAQKGNKIDE